MRKQEKYSLKKNILDKKLASLVDFSKNLQEQRLFDGEIFINRNGKILLDLHSKDIAAYDSFNKPQYMIGSISKQFFAVALLKALYEFSNFRIEKLRVKNVQKQLHLPISKFLPESLLFGMEICLYGQMRLLFIIYLVIPQESQIILLLKNFNLLLKFTLQCVGLNLTDQLAKL